MSNYFVDMNNLSYVFDQETDLKTSTSKREYNKDVFTGWSNQFIDNNLLFKYQEEEKKC